LNAKYVKYHSPPKAEIIRCALINAISRIIETKEESRSAERKGHHISASSIAYLEGCVSFFVAKDNKRRMPSVATWAVLQWKCYDTLSLNSPRE
jgi:hypothetical protein